MFSKIGSVPKVSHIGNLMISNSDFVQLIRSKIVTVFEKDNIFRDPRIHWEFLKYKMREFSRGYSVDK